MSPRHFLLFSNSLSQGETALVWCAGEGPLRSTTQHSVVKPFPLCQSARLSKDTSGVTVTRCRQELLCITTGTGSPAQATPAWACSPQQSREHGTPTGVAAGRAKQTKTPAETAGKSNAIYNRKGRHSWRERSRRGNSSHHN